MIFAALPLRLVTELGARRALTSRPPGWSSALSGAKIHSDPIEPPKAIQCTQRSFLLAQNFFLSLFYLFCSEKPPQINPKFSGSHRYLAEICVDPN